MLLESETDLTLALGLAAGVGLLLALILLVLWIRAAAALRKTNEDLAKTEIGADRTERRLFNILQAIPVAIVETDATGKFVFANRAAQSLLGRKDAELLGLRFHSATWGITYPDGRLIPPDLLPAARALRGQTVKGFQHLMVNPNTRKKMLVSVTAQPILNDAGEVIGSSSAIVESESLAAPGSPEDDLRARWFDVAGVLLAALGPDGKVREINSRGAEILGLSVDEIVGRDWIDSFLPEEDRAEARAFFAEVQEGRRDPPEGEGIVVRADGSRRTIRWRGTAVRDQNGRATLVLTSGEDITPEAEAPQPAPPPDPSAPVAAAGRVGLWSLTPASATRWDSPEVYDLWGVPQGSDLNAAQRELIHPDDRAAVERAFQAAWNGETPAYACDFRVVRPDGETRWLSARGAVTRDEAGRPVGLQGAAWDITDLKAEAARAVEAETDSRRRTEQALGQAQKLEQAGRAASGMALDFHTLMSVVVNALDTLLRQADNPERVRRLGEAALTANRRGEQLTRQLMAFAEPQDQHAETVDAGQFLRALEPRLARITGDTALAVEIGDDLGLLRLDPVPLETAIGALLTNAAQSAGATGSVTLRANRVRLAEGEMEDVAPGDYLRVAVTDTGAGMDADTARRATEAFFTTRQGAQGLGLAQAKAFARQAGGDLSIDTAPDAGATVALLLPVAG